MTPLLKRGLWLWAGALALMLTVIIPLPTAMHVIAILVITGVVIKGYVQSKKVYESNGSLVFVEGKNLPPASYSRPIILVCGDGLGGLFGAVLPEQSAIRVSEQGCYVGVAKLDQLQAAAESILRLRPDWNKQLSVMFVINPGEHNDLAILTAQVRTLYYQTALVRKLGINLPLMFVSYLEASCSKGVWFSWEGGSCELRAHEAGVCTRVADWQAQSSDSKNLAARYSNVVKLGSFAEWWRDEVMYYMRSRDASDFQDVSCFHAITFVPALHNKAKHNLWQQWLYDKFCLIEKDGATQHEMLPFPDGLLHCLPVRTCNLPLRRASVLALWMFTLVGVIAMLSSYWQNNLLLRQVSDDLRRFSAIPQPSSQEDVEFTKREAALSVLRHDAERLDSYYRRGEPPELGLGLYRGEILRMPLLSAIANYRQPANQSAPRPVGPVLLNSLSLFSIGSARLKTESTPLLVKALLDIKAQPGGLIVIGGHTDATGLPEYNVQLSRERAAAVKEWMQQMADIPERCFAVQGFGASQPIASNDTEHGRAANRRVEIRLVPEAGACALSATESGRKPLSQIVTFK